MTYSLSDLKDRIVEESKRGELGDISGADFLGSGTGRIAYRIKDERYGSEYKGKVFKIAIPTPNGSARDKNKKELQTWQVVKSNKRLVRHFCPIRDVSKNYSWIVMDYANPVKFSRIRSSKKKYQIEKVLKFLEDKDLDLHKGNIGKHPELGIVLIDYPWGAKFDF